MSMRQKERVKKSEERIEESGGNVRGFWLNCDREKWTAIEKLKGAEHEWSFQKGLKPEKPEVGALSNLSGAQGRVR
jgi:hypothetical protein